MPVVDHRTDPVSGPLRLTQELIAACPTFREWIEVGTENDAVARIYPNGTPADDTTFPRVVVVDTAIEIPWGFASGEITVQFQALISETDPVEVEQEFRYRVGKIAGEMIDLGRQPGRLAVRHGTGITLPTIQRSAETDEQDQLMAELIVQFGPEE